MRRATWIFVGLLIAGPVVGARADRVVLGTAAHGRFYLQGSFVPPPYEISIAYELVGVDTNWKEVFVNDLPVWRPPAPELRVVNPGHSLWTDREAAAHVAVMRTVPPGPVSLERTRRIATAYASLDTMVDSARAVSAHHLRVYWHGEKYPWDMEIDDRPQPTPVQLSHHFVDLAIDKYVRPLVMGWLVLQGHRNLTLPSERAEDLDRELDWARRGRPGPYFILPTKEDRDEFLEPVPLPDPER